MSTLSRDSGYPNPAIDVADAGLYVVSWWTTHAPKGKIGQKNEKLGGSSHEKGSIRHRPTLACRWQCARINELRSSAPIRPGRTWMESIKRPASSP